MFDPSPKKDPTCAHMVTASQTNSSEFIHIIYLRAAALLFSGGHRIGRGPVKN